NHYRSPGTGSGVRPDPRAGLRERLRGGRRRHPLHRGGDQRPAGRRDRHALDLRAVAPHASLLLRRFICPGTPRSGTDLHEAENSVSSTALVVLLLAQQTPVPVDFERDIRPIFKASCVKCHGAEGKPKGQLRLDLRAAAFRGGVGGKSIVPGKAAESLLYKLLV